MEMLLVFQLLLSVSIHFPKKTGIPPLLVKLLAGAGGPRPLTSPSEKSLAYASRSFLSYDKA